jgi:hypothetical protein
VTRAFLRPLPRLAAKSGVAALASYDNLIFVHPFIISRFGKNNNIYISPTNILIFYTLNYIYFLHTINATFTTGPGGKRKKEEIYAIQYSRKSLFPTLKFCDQLVKTSSFKDSLTKPKFKLSVSWFYFEEI